MAALGNRDDTIAQPAFKASKKFATRAKGKGRGEAKLGFLGTLTGPGLAA
jgi:hypothetical protein